jgi:hypothetical protein
MRARQIASRVSGRHLPRPEPCRRPQGPHFSQRGGPAGLSPDPGRDLAQDRLRGSCRLPPAQPFCLVVETPNANLVAGMRWFLSAYTLRFNHRHRQFGHGRGRKGVVRAAGGVRGLRGAACAVLGSVPERGCLLELQIEVRALAGAVGHQGGERRVCATCGFTIGFTGPRLAIAASSVPSDVDLFRLEQFSREIVVTQKFVDAVGQLGLTDIRFRPASAQDD